MPLRASCLDFLKVYISTMSFPDIVDDLDLDDSEVEELHEKLNIRFQGRSGEWLCFMGSRPGVSGMSDSKLKALAFLLQRSNLSIEDVL